MALFKNWIFWGLVVSVIVSIVGYVFSYPIQFNLCTADFTTLTFDTSCLRNFSLMGTKLFYPSIALGVVFLVLLFVPRAVSAWWKFAIWYIPITALVIGWPEGTGWYIGTPAEELVRNNASFYVGASLGVIIVAFINDRRKRAQKKPFHTLWYWGFGIVLGNVAMYSLKLMF